uniref:hypothetical protein n=1 Tax=Flavobacterium sp. TaxID=239 RepID=UPI00404921CD
MKNIRNFVDTYLYYALIIDIIAIALLWFANSKLSIFTFSLNNTDDNIEIVSNIIGASVSLAGFILASLTIIVAIRSNIVNKTPEQSQNPLQLFFSIGTFKTIVKVFKIAIIELILCFIASYLIWTVSANLSNFTIFKTIIVLIYLMAMSTIRSLFVLFLLIEADK